MRMSVVVATSTLILTGLAGCGDSTGLTSAPSSEAAAGPDSQPAPAPRGWRPTARERHLLGQAEAVLAAACMRKAGFEFWPELRPWMPEWELPYVIDDPVWARTHGYGGARRRESDAEMNADPNAAYVRRLPTDRRQAYDAVMFGSDPNAVSVDAPAGGRASIADTGCLADARRSLYGDLGSWYAADVIDRQLELLVVPHTSANERFKRTLADWSQCVRAAGYAAAAPADLREFVRQQSDGRPPAVADTLEREVALTEANCAKSTGLGSLARTLDRRLTAAVERRYSAPLLRLRALQQAALPRARELVGKEPVNNNR